MTDATPASDGFLDEILEVLLELDIVDDEYADLLEGIATVATIVAKALRKFRQNRIDNGLDPLAKVILEGMQRRRQERLDRRRERRNS